MDSILNLFMENFELILTLAVFVTGGFYIFDNRTYRKERKKLETVFKENSETQTHRQLYADRLAECLRTTPSEKMPADFHSAQNCLTQQKPLNHEQLHWLRVPVFPNERFVDNFSSSFWILLIIWFVRSFMLEPFRIPSGSMEPTLYAGDFILTNKSSYGVRLPVIGTKIFPFGEVKRGDVVVFKYPKNPKINYIKRVIGLPNDKIFIDNGVVSVNGKKQDITLEIKNDKSTIYTEALEGHPHKVQFYPAYPQIGRGVLTVPKGHYFVMGDNRDGSEDSRSWGYVPEENMVGKAFFIWMNGNCVLGKGSCNRIGSVIE